MLGDGQVQKIQILGSASKKGPDIFSLIVQSCDVSCRADLIKHPVESGSWVFDNKVRQPRVITIKALVGAKDEETKKYLRGIWRNRTYEFYEIATREATYRNFCCEECSHNESADKMDALEYTIRFCEIIKATTRNTVLDVDDQNATGYGAVGA